MRRLIYSNIICRRQGYSTDFISTTNEYNMKQLTWLYPKATRSTHQHLTNEHITFVYYWHKNFWQKPTPGFEKRNWPICLCEKGLHRKKQYDNCTSIPTQTGILAGCNCILAPRENVRWYQILFMITDFIWWFFSIDDYYLSFAE